MHVMLITFLIIAAVVATGFLFVFWLIVTLLRGAGRLLFGPPPGRQMTGPIHHQMGPMPMPMRACERVSCRALNPLDARFCRRCGQKLHMPQQVPVRRAAML